MFNKSLDKTIKLIIGRKVNELVICIFINNNNVKTLIIRRKLTKNRRIKTMRNDFFVCFYMQNH